MKLDRGSCLTGEQQNHPNDTIINKLFEDLLQENSSLLDQVALHHAETKQEITFGKLNEDANALARVLLRKIKNEGMRPNSDGDYIVALRFVPDETLVTTILAIFKAGLAYVPLAPNWPEKRVQHIINDAEPIMVITNVKADILFKAQKSLPFDKKRDVFNFQGLYSEAVNSKTSVQNLPSNQTLNNSLKGNRLYAVLYTSGSTGTPKGVRHLHRAALNRFFWQWRLFPYETDEVCLFKTTLTFVDSVTEIWSALLCGKKLVIFPTKYTQNVERFVELLEEHRIGRVFVVTSLVRNILAFANLDKTKPRLPLVKIWDCSAEPVTKDLLESFFAYFPYDHIISNFYGSTEMMDVTFETFKSLNDVKAVILEEKVPIGFPIDNTKAYILDEEMRPVGEGVIGSLYIASRNLGDGYVGEKKGSFMPNNLIDVSTKFAGNHDYSTLYKTGDFAMNKNGRLYYEGRADSQVKVRGHRVDLSEIEKAVMDVEGVTKACILCFKPGLPEQKVLCYYTVADDTVLPESKLELKLCEVLPEYSMPKLILLSSMPLLVNGKTDRQELFRRFEDSLKCKTFIFSNEDLEIIEEAYRVKAKVLLESVASIIQNPDHKPTLKDRFFDIGGDSINMVMVISKLKDYGYNISITNFVSSCQLADIARHISTDEVPDDLEAELKIMREENKYTSGVLKADHKDLVLDMVSRSFAEKGDLTTLADVTYEILMDQLVILWERLLEANLSIVIYDSNNEPIAACLNFDARSPEASPLCANSAVTRSMGTNLAEEDDNQNTENDDIAESRTSMSVVEFLEAVEEPLKDEHLPREMGQFVYTSMLGTAKHLR